MDAPRQPSALDCMHCGFCLQACPTYQETGDENESPRGRLFLMRAVNEDRLPLDATVVAHLDHCLDCRACETACPSGVEYGRVLEPFRVRLEEDAQRTGRSRLSRWTRPLHRKLLPNRRALRWALAPARLGQRLGLGRAATALGLPRLLPAPLRRFVSQLPPPPPRVAALPARLDPATPPSLSVGLLLGCATETFTPQVNRAAAAVLQALGCAVVTPRAQGCCGALAYHEGRAADARGHWQALAEVFGGADGPDLLVTTAAGCGSMLHELGRVSRELGADSPALDRLHARARDFHQVVAERGLPDTLRPVRMTAVYDPACHLLHAQGVRDEPLALLRAVPGLELRNHDEADLCCGAAGSYVLTEPDFSDRIGLRKARKILDTGAEAVLTANVGCALQLQRCLARLGQPLPVLHPAQVLAAALGVGPMPGEE